MRNQILCNQGHIIGSKDNHFGRNSNSVAEFNELAARAIAIC